MVEKYTRVITCLNEHGPGLGCAFAVRSAKHHDLVRVVLKRMTDIVLPGSQG